ncbi:MAG: 3-isopropylmalate dehydratase, partial [Candidatus Marinimicrobia bacterium]|nr:3-isopropylmalate dehydratase [Candidatus Neomarinimicrobiota bacterium]
MKFIFEGDMPAYLTAKDLILQILGDITTDGATYRAMEFAGSTIRAMKMEERMTICNMAIEAGGMNGIIEADEVTEAYLKGKAKTSYDILHSDADAKYVKTIQYNTADLEPLVAQPHSPDNRATVRKVQGTKVSKCYIGSCTGGKLFDFVAAAKVLKGKEVKVPTSVVPSTTTVNRQLAETMIDGKSVKDILLDAGCEVAPPSCAACLGGPSDTFGRSVDGDVVISTTNRNFPGRMGSKQAEVYLASPLTVAASALHGMITDPREEL